MQGLATEAQTIDELDNKLKSMVPELPECNRCMPIEGTVVIELLASRLSTILPAAA